MKRFFLRLYLGILVAVFLAGGAAVYAMGTSFERDVTRQLETVVAVPALYVSNELARLGPQEAEHLSDRLGYPVEIFEITELDLHAEDKERLIKGETVMSRTVRPPWVYAPIQGSTQVARLGPLAIVRPAAGGRALVVSTVLALAVLIAIGLLFYPLQRQLHQLSRAAQRFGEGNLESRAAIRPADALGNLGSEFDDMATRIQEQVEGQRHLFRAVSHELRTPLARLRFALELMRDVVDPVALESQIDAASGDIDELDRLVAELLLYARLQRGAPPLDFTSVDLGKLVSRVVEELALLTDEKAVKVVVSGKALVYGSEEQLHRVVLNLAKNAIRHADSLVQLSVSSSEKGVVLAVEDDGAGVQASDRERIFEPFVRLDESRQRETGGSGLGLALVKRIVDWHGGDVRVGDAELGGARFEVVVKVS